jgi:hypothetical protein
MGDEEPVMPVGDNVTFENTYMQKPEEFGDVRLVFHAPFSVQGTLGDENAAREHPRQTRHRERATRPFFGTSVSTRDFVFGTRRATNVCLHD